MYKYPNQMAEEWWKNPIQMTLKLCSHPIPTLFFLRYDSRI